MTSHIYPQPNRNPPVDPLSGRVQAAQRENHELTQLRDWLLPLLMNGQVRVA